MLFVILLAAMMLWPMGSPENLFSQTGFDLWNKNSLNHDSWGAGRRVLDYQFDRADRELSPDRWMEEGRRGIMTARAVLAEMLPEVFLDQQANAQFMEWSERELEKRFTRWLLERFFGAGVEVPAAAVFRETGEAGKSLVYFTGPDGSILYDPNTGDPHVIRPGDEGYDFAEDLLSWREMTHNAAGRELQNYQTGIMEKYPELMIYIPSERKEEFERKLAEAGGQAVLSLKHEFEAILAREERYFTARRLGDVWSLRKKSEDKAAAAIGAMLIEEARQVCADGIASIEAKIEAAKADATDLTLAGNEWLEEYREQFNRGLNAWESAEERFLLRRIEWELSAERAFHEGMEIWNAVFVRFEEERRKWENEARLLFMEGEQFFVKASQTLEAAIAAARAEFERDARLRTGVASERAGAMANMYLLSSAAAEEARKNIDFWIERYMKANHGIQIPSGGEAFEKWVDEELLHMMSAADGLEKINLEELYTWAALRRSYTARAQESLHTLARELYSITGVWDHYETELLRAEAEAEYWRNRTFMAEAVAAYAEALDAGRMTAAESLDAWEKAKSAYDEAALLYGAADDSLGKGGAGLSAARNAFLEAAEKMRAAASELETLRHNYQSMVNVMRSTGSDMITEELALLYRLLGESRDLLGSSNEYSLWGRFMASAHALETRQLEEMRAEVLLHLIAGDGENFGSLADLALKADSGDLFESGLLLALAERLHGEERINAGQYDLLLSVILNSSKSRAKTDLDLRLAAISLLAENGSSADWYFSVRNADAPGTVLPDMEAQLFSDWEKDNIELLRARAELELNVLDFIEGTESTEAAAILALLYTGDEIKRRQDREALEQILELLNTGALAVDEKMLFFLSGGSFIDQEYGQEITGAFLSDYVCREEFSRSLYNTYIGFSDLAKVIIRENLEQAFGQLKNLWETFGIETADSLSPAAGQIINAMPDLDIHNGISPFLFALDEIFYNLPVWLNLNFTLWKESLIEYSVSPSEDVFVLAERHNTLLNAALLHLLNEEQAAGTPDSYPADNLLYEDYEIALEKLLEHYSRERHVMGEIARLSSLLDMTNGGTEAAEYELKNASAAIALAEEAYAELAGAYQEAADNFQRAGAAYDALYDEAEQAFKNLKDARNAFETQDAIRLWAETAYLDANRPMEELAYCRERAGKAMDVLQLLESLLADRKILEGGEYENVYVDYKESLSLFTLSHDALYKFERAIEAERARNDAAYLAYQNQLSVFGRSFFFEEDYVFSEDKSEWDIKDIITIDNNGFLVFAMNNNRILSGPSEERAEMLREYFTPSQIIDGETYMVSPFELALRKLRSFLFPDNMTMNDYMELAVARDYLIQRIISSNPEAGKVSKWYNAAGSLGSNQNLGNMIIDPSGNKKVYTAANFHISSLGRIKGMIWNLLGENKRKALEFYTILTLLGGGGSNSEYFSSVTEYLVYDNVFNDADDNYNYYRKRANSVLGAFYKNSYDITKATRNSLALPRDRLNKQIGMAYFGLTETLSSMDEKLNAYKESSEKFVLLTGGKNKAIRWEDIEKALALTDGFNGDTTPLRELWEQMSGNMENEASNIHEALKLLAESCRNLKEEKYLHLHMIWQADEYKRAAHETDYRELYNAYIAGHAALEDLQAAAVLSFGGNQPSGKEHIENTGNALMESLYRFAGLGLSGTAGASLLAVEYSGIISRAWEEKYSAELNIRMNEWNLQRKDIQEKFNNWLDSAGIILEQGLTAWKESEEKLHEAGNMWAKTFEEEYGRISDAWTAAYLEGLRDKDAWAAAALEAAGQASSAAATALIGSSAEAGARAMDTRDPLGFMNVPDAREGEKILSELLQRSGAGALAGAFGSIRASAGTLATIVRTGLSGGGIWNSASAQTEATALARTVREEFESRESRKMAFMVVDAANDFYMALEEMIRLANEQFIKQLDDEFIIGGQWRKSETGYVKNVIVHSTLFKSIITERAEVEGYRDFIFSHSRSLTHTDEETIRNLNTFQAEALVDSVSLEIKELRDKIFDPDTGDFAAHTGEVPNVKPKPDIEKGRSGVFNDFGYGELGRLFTEFYFWTFKEQYGIAAVAAAPWDKPFWDSRDSAINAPSIRSTVNTVLSAGIIITGAAGAIFTGGGSLLGGIALSAALNSADDFVFSTLDAVGGYKSFGAAGFEFGKALLSNTVTAAAGAVFNGVQGISLPFFGSGGMSGLVVDHGLDGVMYKTVTSGINTFTTGTINSIIASVSYDDKNGFGFSGDAFIQNFKGSITGALSGAAGTFTSGLMDLGITGFTGEVYANGHQLSNLSGGLVSQGINYALGNDFILNILNAGMFFHGDESAGLVEMRLGRNGISFELGSGGADASIAALAGAAMGLEAWMVNMELLLSANRDSRTYASQMRTLYSGSYTNWLEYENILAGRTVVEERRNVAWTQSIYDEASGIKTIYLGNDALNDGSRFGLNVVFSHESYRDGIYNGKTGQEIERNNAVMGHIATANALIAAYGMDSISFDMAMEAMLFNYAMHNDIALAASMLESYDSSADYWKLMKNNDGTWSWYDDRSADFDITDLINDREVQKRLGIEKSGILHVLAASRQQDGKTFGTISAGRMTPELAVVLGYIAAPKPLAAGRHLNGLYFPSHLEVASNAARNLIIQDTLDKIAYNAAHTVTIYDNRGRPVTLHNIDEANSITRELLQQISPSLSGIDNMQNFGCNFMAIISIPQLLTKQILNSQQVTEIWHTAIRRGFLYENGYVRDRNALANLALQKLGITNFGVSLDGNRRNNSSLVGYRVHVPYEQTGHFVLTGTNKSLIYNPATSFTTDQNRWISTVEILVYGK